MSMVRHESFSLSDRGYTREKNEDCVFALSSTVNVGDYSRACSLLAVSDGVGGNPGGEVASRIAIESISKGFLGDMLLEWKSSMEELMKKSILAAHTRITTISSASVEYPDMAATLTAALLIDHICCIGHVGDSCCYIFLNGMLEKLTIDQAVGNMLQQALGIHSNIDVFVRSVELLEGDIVLVCSDGLTKQVSEDDIAITLSKEIDVSSMCSELVEKANSSGGRDNVSVAVLRLLGA